MATNNVPTIVQENRYAISTRARELYDAGKMRYLMVLVQGRHPAEVEAEMFIESLRGYMIIPWPHDESAYDYNRTVFEQNPENKTIFFSKKRLRPA